MTAGATLTIASKSCSCRTRVAKPVVGREPDVDVCLDWDADVSRVHAILEPHAGEWAVVDDGISKNGTFVNGIKLVGRRRLRDGVVLRCGWVVLYFVDPRGQTGRANG
jgi:FHA domain